MQRLGRRAIAFCIAALVVGSSGAILTKSKAQPAPGEDASVLAADTALGDAMRAGDKWAARRLLALQFTYTDENGKLHARREFLAELASLAPAAPADVAVKIYGLVAMVTGHRKSAQGGDAFFLDIWAKEKRSWRALAMQDVVLAAAAGARPTEPETPAELQSRNEPAKAFDCRNPCETIPYRVRSAAEQDIVNAFQAVEKATVAHDAEEWAKHFADEFAHYESGAAPLSKPERITLIENQKAHDTPALVTPIQSMRLWVYGDGAAMISANGAPDGSETQARIARVWVRRNGQWQMAISVQTGVK